MSERLLIIQMAKLGDFIQTTPLLANLRRQHDRAEIVMVGEQAAALEAARLSPLVDTVVKVDGSVNSLEHLGRFHGVFVLNSHLRAVNLAETVIAENRYGPCRDEHGIRFTPVQNFLMSLMRLKRDSGRFNLVDVWASLLPDSAPHPLVWPSPASSNLIPEEAGLKIGFQLGSRNHLRRWPVENFVRLAADLAELRPERLITPVLLGSAEERTLGSKFERISQSYGLARPVNLLGRTSLEELGQAVAGLDLLVTADTGVMHLAAAVGTPVLALFFGPAYGPETGPYGPGHIIYQATAPCGPCRERGDCRRRQCLEMPAPETAAHLAARMIGPRDPELVNPLLAERPMPAGHRVWLTGADGFGQTLHPLGRPVLTDDEALIHLITAAGRKFIRPNYKSAVHDLRKVISGYQVLDKPKVIDGRFLSELAAKGFSGGRQERETFLDTVGNLAQALGLKLA